MGGGSGAGVVRGEAGTPRFCERFGVFGDWEERAGSWEAYG